MVVRSVAEIMGGAAAKPAPKPAEKDNIPTFKPITGGGSGDFLSNLPSTRPGDSTIPTFLPSGGSGAGGFLPPTTSLTDGLPRFDAKTPGEKEGVPSFKGVNLGGADLFKPTAKPAPVPSTQTPSTLVSAKPGPSVDSFAVPAKPQPTQVAKPQPATQPAPKPQPVAQPGAQSKPTEPAKPPPPSGHEASFASDAELIDLQNQFAEQVADFNKTVQQVKPISSSKYHAVLSACILCCRLGRCVPKQPRLQIR